MLKQALWIGAMSLLCYLVTDYRSRMDIDRYRVFYKTAPGPCRTVVEGGGSEDFVELDDDTVLFSSGLNMAGKPGKISALYTNGSVSEAVILNADGTPLLAPHGIALWTDPKTGALLLYVVVHAPDYEGVAVFEITNKTPLTLKYIETIKDDTFTGFMNDLAVVGRNKFYISRTVITRNPFIMILELALFAPTGYLVYYDGSKGRVVLSGMAVSNGVALSRDKRTLYLSEFAKKSIHALTIQPNGDVTTQWISNLGSGPDNIQVDRKSGDLWVGAFPYLYKPLLGIFGPYSHEAQVLRVRLTDNKVSGIDVIYANNDNFTSGASVALFKNNKLFIGTVTSQLIMCDVKYLPD